MGFSRNRKKKVKIFGVPLDLGANPLGVEMGPTAIRYAGLTKALEFNNIEYEDEGDLSVNGEKYQNGSLKAIARISEELAERVDLAITQGYTAVILGGDHSASIGAIAGASRKNRRTGLLWLDCHPDANTPETSPSGNVHGMTVAISMGYGYPELVNCGGFSPKIFPENLCILGAKDIDLGERELLDRLEVSLFTLIDIEKYGIVEVCNRALNIVSSRTDTIHVSLDVDVLDPFIAPGTGIVSRGGLSYREISYIMTSIGSIENVCSIDIIEVNPLRDIKNQTAELSVELLLTLLQGSYGDYERHYLGETFLRKT
jgi:arginase